MNIMVFVSFTWTGIPCTSLPNFLYDVPHPLLYLGLFMRCRISISSRIFSSKTALRICIENILMGIFSAVTFSFAVSTHASIASWVNDQKRVLLLVLYTGAVCCVYFTLGNAAQFIFRVSAANIGDRLEVSSLVEVVFFSFWVLISVLIYPPLEVGYPPFKVGWSYLEMVVLAGILCVCVFLLCDLPLTSWWVPGMWALL